MFDIGMGKFYVLSERNYNDFHIPFKSYKSYLKNLLLYKFPSIWNSLPNELKAENHEKVFLTKLNIYSLEEVQFLKIKTVLTNEEIKL